MPADVNAEAPWPSEEPTIRSANAPATPMSQGDGRRQPPLRSWRAASDREHQQGRVREADGSSGDLDRGEVPSPEQAQDNGDEEDEKEGITRRPPQRS